MTVNSLPRLTVHNAVQLVFVWSCCTDFFIAETVKLRELIGCNALAANTELLWNYEAGCSLVLCRSQTCRSNKRIYPVNEVNGITWWTDSFLFQFSWAQPWSCRPGVELTQRTVRTWFSFTLWFVHDSRTYCRQRTDAEDVILVQVLCWKWRCVTHPGQRRWFTVHRGHFHCVIIWVHVYHSEQRCVSREWLCTVPQ